MDQLARLATGSQGHRNQARPVTGTSLKRDEAPLKTGTANKGLFFRLPLLTQAAIQQPSIPKVNGKAMNLRSAKKCFSQKSARFLPSLFLVAAAVLMPHRSFGLPRAPMPPLPEMTVRLCQENFDGPYFALGTNRTETVNTSYGLLVSSWSGYGLERAGTVTSFVVPGVDGAGKTNVASEGAIRFWLTPYWGSAAAGGSGPEKTARLLELIAVGETEAVTVWSLQVSEDGNAISLFEQSETGAVQLLSAEITWTANTPHGLALNYCPTGSVLFVDGQVAATGSGTYPVTPGVAGLVIGSAVDGTDTAGGYLDRVATFGKPLTLSAVTFHYNGNADEAALGPVSEEESAAQQAMWEEWAKQKAQQEEIGGGMQMMMMLLGPTETCFTNSPLFITNVSCFLTNQGWVAQFEVHGTNSPADIFTTTNIVGSHITNSQWFWLERGPTCAVYQYTNQPDAQAFFILGSMQDLDADALTDAYETLVSKTDPNNPDTDGDGVSDGDELLIYHTDPNNQDSDGDGVIDQPFKVMIARPTNNSTIP